MILKNCNDEDIRKLELLVVYYKSCHHFPNREIQIAITVFCFPPQSQYYL